PQKRGLRHIQRPGEALERLDRGSDVPVLIPRQTRLRDPRDLLQVRLRVPRLDPCRAEPLSERASVGRVTPPPAPSLVPNVRPPLMPRPLSTKVARRGIYPEAEPHRNAASEPGDGGPSEPRHSAASRICRRAPTRPFGYLISTAAPAPSSCSFALSAASLLTFSRTGFGAQVT